MSEAMKYMKRIEKVGSRVTCSPPPMDTDEDFLVPVAQEDLQDLAACLDERGFELGGSEVVPAEDDNCVVGQDDFGFQSWKKGSINFILTCSEEFFDKFMEATRIAKEKNLLLKEERIALFQKVLYGVNIPANLSVENW